MPSSDQDAKAPAMPRPDSGMVKSVIMLSTGFFGVFVAYNTTQALETTLVEKKLADISLGVLYVLFTICAIFATKIVEVIGPKLSMVIGAVPYVLICLSNLKPSYYLTVPAFGLVGLGAAILWTGQGVYLGRCALYHAHITGESEDAVTSRFNGIFFAAFQFNGFIGSMIAAIAFTGGKDNESTQRAVFLGFACAAALGTFVLTLLKSVPVIGPEPSPGDDLKVEPGGARDPVSLVETLQLAVHSPQMTMSIPVILYNGMSLGFIFSDYPLFYADNTKKDIVRLMPSARVGFVISAFYIANSAASYGWGKAAAKIGRRGCMFLATVLHILFYVLLLVFNNHSVFKHIGHESAAAYGITFALAVLFALGDAVWESQPPAVLQSSSFFPKERDREAAMSNLKMWQSLGFAIQFVFGFVIHELWIKLVILLVLQVLSSMALYYVHTKVVSLDSSTPAVANARIINAEEKDPLISHHND